MFATVIVRLSVGIQFLNYVKRYPYYCESDDYECGADAWGRSHEMWIPGDMQR